MKNFVFPEIVYEGLTQHLIDMEENKNSIIEDLSLKQAGENFILAFKTYLNELQQILHNAAKSSAPDNSTPLITVGSKVRLSNIDNSKEYIFHIVSPSHKRSNTNVISCISPVGKSLLLKRVGDIVEVEAPGGIFKYKVESIQYIGEQSF